LKFHWLFSWRIYHRGKNEPRPDCIIVNDTPLGDSLSAWILARRSGAKLILDITDEWPDQFVVAFPPSFRRLILRLFSPLFLFRKYIRRRADGISALCQDYFHSVQKEVPAPQSGAWLTVYNGVDITAFRRILNDQATFEGLNLGAKKLKNELWVIYAGTLGNTYDIPTILEAAELLEKRGSPVRFLIAGDGPFFSVVKTFAGQHQALLTHVGKLKPQDLIQVYKKCDVGLAAYGPGSTVAMPDKAYDYLAAGLVVVTSLRGELAEWLNKRQCGILYQAGNAQSLANVLQDLVSKTDLIKKMAQNSYDTAALFDRTLQYQKYADWVEFILGGGVAANVRNQDPQDRDGQGRSKPYSFWPNGEDPRADFR
jgi:glycosyltransferase involved in cell wall biosynthesis